MVWRSKLILKSHLRRGSRWRGHIGEASHRLDGTLVLAAAATPTTGTTAVSFLTAIVALIPLVAAIASGCVIALIVWRIGPVVRRLNQTVAVGVSLVLLHVGDGNKLQR